MKNWNMPKDGLSLRYRMPHMYFQIEAARMNPMMETIAPLVLLSALCFA
jgi:hypothetical protein